MLYLQLYHIFFFLSRLSVGPDPFVNRSLLFAVHFFKSGALPKFDSKKI